MALFRVRAPVQILHDSFPGKLAEKQLYSDTLVQKEDLLNHPFMYSHPHPDTGGNIFGAGVGKLHLAFRSES